MADQVIITEEIFSKSQYKDRQIIEKLHDYMIENNIELVHFLIKKNEYADFLISRSDNAIYEFKSASDANFTDPKEIMNEVLFTGIENSYSEYVESMLMELPHEITKELKNSPIFKKELERIVNDCVPVFCEFLGTPYSSSQERLDRKLLKRMKKSLTELKF